MAEPSERQSLMASGTVTGETLPSRFPHTEETLPSFSSPSEVEFSETGETVVLF
jgi:hypothetical protein